MNKQVELIKAEIALPEEPVSGLDNGKMSIDRWKEACKAASNQANYREKNGLTETRDDYFVDGVQWADEHPKEEPVSEDLSEYINELSKQFPEVSFAKLSRIAVRVTNWQKEQFEKNRLAACDRQTKEEAEREQDFVDSIIKNEHRTPTFDDAIKYGMKIQMEQIWEHQRRFI